MKDTVLIRVASDRAHEALDWIESRGYLEDVEPWKLVETRLFLDDMLEFNPPYVPVSLDNMDMSVDDILLFKLTFAR